MTTREERVADAIRQQIRSGQYAPGSRLPSYRLLAQEHGVSVGTIRLVMRELHRTGWTEAERGVAVFVREDHPV